MLRYIGIAISFLLSTTGLYSQAFFLDHPALSPDGEVVYFTYQSDIWKVSTAGGEATRVTAMDGQETDASVSPDGQWIAFSGSPLGNKDVYLMPIGGGDIRQLTFHQSDDKVESWSWDSKTIYFTSSRENEQATYAVSIEGGTPKRVFSHFFNRDHNLVQHPDGSYYFNESWESSRFTSRKGYVGAFNPDIRHYDPKSKTYTVRTDHKGKDMYPIIDKHGEVYYVSDEHNGQYNIYRLSDKTPLTKHNSSIYYPSIAADGSKIAYRKDYQLWVTDVASGTSSKVEISFKNYTDIDQEESHNISGDISNFDVSPDGKKFAMVSRGELFVSDVKGKYIRQIPTAESGRVLECHWLEDNKTIIYNQTYEGYQNWFTTSGDGTSQEKQLTRDMRNNRNLAFNSDRSKAVYFSGRDEVRLMDMKTFHSSVLCTDEIWGFQNDRPTWAPDDKHVLYSAYRNFERDIFIVDVHTKKVTNMTKTGVTEMFPSISPDGKYLYYVSNPHVPLYPFGLKDGKVYRIPLQKYSDPSKTSKFDELFTEKEKKDDDKDDKEEKTKKKKVTVSIDYTDFLKRKERISPRFGSQSSYYLVQKDDKTTVLYDSDHDEGDGKLWKTVLEPFESPKTTAIEGSSRRYKIKEAKDTYYMLSKGNLYTLNVDGGKTEKISMDASFSKPLRAEFEQMFDETWANMEENFYLKSFHGVDWKKMKDTYKVYLPYVSNREDLRLLLNDMLGELNTSHYGFRSYGDEESTRHDVNTADIGVVYGADHPYRVERIIKDGPSDKVDVDIRKGDVLVAVQGKRVKPTDNREAYFVFPSRPDELVLTLSRAGKEHDVILHPARSTKDNRYNEWQDSRQKYIDDRTDKKIAHVHMKNMGGGELNLFYDEMVSEWYNSDALILDLRNNRGGNVHDKVLQFLSQKTYLNWKYREGQLGTQSNFGVSDKPIVLLINEQSLSDAEMTSAGFKELGLGKIIGVETYRWIIFTSGKGLVDGFYRLPSWGCYTLAGENLERTGVAPDIEVKNTFSDRLEGRDPQLDRAIEEVMKDLEK